MNSFDWMVSLIFMPAGQALAGPLAEVVGEETVLVGAALLIAVPARRPPARGSPARTARWSRLAFPVRQVDRPSQCHRPASLIA